MSNFTFIITFFFSRNTRIKKNIKSFNIFFGVFKIKKTGYKSLLILYLLNKAFNSYILMPAFLLKINVNYNNAITVKAASQVRITITGILKIKRLIFCRKKV